MIKKRTDAKHFVRVIILKFIFPMKPLKSFPGESCYLVQLILFRRISVSQKIHQKIAFKMFQKKTTIKK